MSVEKECVSAPSDAATDSLDLRRTFGVLFVVGDFVAHGSVFDFGARHCGTLYKAAAGRRDEVPVEFWQVVFGLRLPRIALGILVGASLSTAGAGFQALLRNPLADPYVLGVSSGAALGAIISLIVAPHTVGAIQIAAFIGAASTIAGVYFLGRRGGQLDSPTLLLAGIVAASFLSAIIMFLLTMVTGSELRSIAFWLMGDLTAPPPTTNVLGWLGFLFFVFIVAAGAMYTTSSDLNLILTGEQEARHLGVNVNRVKFVVYIAASVLTGLAVSVSGAIGYVRAAGSACDAHVFRHGLSYVDSDGGDWRSHCDCAGRYSGADGGGSDGIAGRRDDGAGWRTRVYLSDAPENAMSAGGGGVVLPQTALRARARTCG